jgi:hypothetical protein
VKPRTVGYIVTLNGEPAGYQERYANLHYAGPRQPVMLFATRKAALDAILSDGAKFNGRFKLAVRRVTHPPPAAKEK